MTFELIVLAALGALALLGMLVYGVVYVLVNFFTKVFFEDNHGI